MFSETIKQCSVSVILTSSVQYDSSAAGYGELCVCGFTQSETEEIFWMNNNYHDLALF